MASRKVSDVVRNQVIFFTPPGSITVREAAIQMKKIKTGALMIVEKGALVGIFTERDALNKVLAEGLDPDKTKVSKVMTKNPQTVNGDMPFTHALQMMHEGCYRHLPVVEGTRPVGIISLRDALGNELVELEHELERQEILSENLC